MRVFLSSTKSDLQAERNALRSVIESYESTNFVGMEIFGARPSDTATESVEEVDRCHLLVLVIGGRYGSGITEKEYQRALDRDIPCLVYLKHEDSISEAERDADTAMALRQREFRRRAGDNTKHTRFTFKSPEELAVRLAGDLLREWLLVGKAKLESVVIAPQPVLKRVRTDRFVGRDWLLKQVDQFIKGGQGYAVIEAAAGMGKTAFAAHLVRTRGYPSHFVELARGTSGVEPALRSLAAQIVLTTPGIDRMWRRRMEQGLPMAPHEFEALLRSASEARASADTPLIIVVDGLDEAGVPDLQNPLGLPKHLPPGVVIIATQRHGVPLEADTPLELLKIDAEAKANRADLRLFLEQAAEWPNVAKARRNGQLDGLPHVYTASDFVNVLLSKSGGVWIYIHHVLAEINDGSHIPLDLDALPSGLREYYAAYWDAWRRRSPDDWGKWELPVLATLAALREPVTLSDLCTLAEVRDTVPLRQRMDNLWRAFLFTTDAKEERRYRLYHLSLNDFFSGKATNVPANRLQSRMQLAEELARATRTAHGRICDHYIRAWGGMEDALPGLRTPTLRDLDGRYGLRWIATHLIQAERGNELYDLLLMVQHGEADTPPCPAWFAAREVCDDLGGFIADARLAFTQLKSRILGSIPTDPKIQSLYNIIGFQSEKLVGNLSKLIRLALMLTSMRSLAGSTPPVLMHLLVRNGIWSIEQAVALAREIPDTVRRVKTLAKLAETCGPERRQALAEEALRTVRADDSQIQSLISLADVLPLLPPDHLREEITRALDMLTGFRPHLQLRAFRYLAPFVSEPRRHEIASMLIGNCREGRSEGDNYSDTFDLMQVYDLPVMLEWLEGETREAALAIVYEFIERRLNYICFSLDSILKKLMPVLSAAEQSTVLRMFVAAQREGSERVVDVRLVERLHPAVAAELWDIMRGG